MSKKSKFLKNSVIYTIGDMLPKFITLFVMIPVFTKYLTTDEYGVYGYVLNIMSLFSIFYLLGLDGALTRFYYNYKDKKSTFISTLWIFLFIYNLILTLVLFFFGEGISQIVFKDIPFDPYFKIMAMYCFFNTFTVMPLIIVRLKEEALKFAVFNLLTTFVNVGFILYFLGYRDQGALGSLKANFITYGIFAVIYFLYILKDLRPEFSMDVLKQGLRFGIPMLPHALGGYIFMVSDRYFLKAYRTDSELGIYNLAYQFGTLIFYLIAAVNKAYVPFFFKTAEEEKESAQSIFQDILRYYSIFILSIGLGLMVFSKEIIVIFARNSAYYGAYKIIPIIVIAYVFEGFYYMCVNGIFYSKKTEILAAITASTALLDLLLNYLLIPRYGMYGAATATLIAYFASFLLTYRYSQKFYYIKWNWCIIAVNILICSGILALSFIDFNNFGLNFLYKIVLYVIYIVLLFALKVLSYDKLVFYGKKILKK